MLVRAPNGSFESIDFRETAPAAAFQEMYRGNPNGSMEGGLARFVMPPFLLKRLTAQVLYPANCAAWSISTKSTALSPGRL